MKKDSVGKENISAIGAFDILFSSQQSQNLIDRKLL